jgi:serine O-acetyltransferase
MTEHKKIYKQHLLNEVYKNEKGIIKKIFLKYFNPNTNALFMIRKRMYFYHTSKRIRLKFMDYKLAVKYGIFLGNLPIIGTGLSIRHPHGIFISNAVIGKNCNIYQDVTIGDKKLKEFDSSPIIGDNVTIYAGAKIVGKVTIGNNVIIGTNSVVTKSFGDNLIVAGNPARVIGSIN